MTSPQVPLVVDDATGVWSSDGQPMILIPRRFFVFLQMEAEKLFGLEGAQDLYDAASRRGARIWCENEARRSDSSGREIFTRYLNRVSSRGMGRFTLLTLDAAQCAATVEFDQSIFVAEYGPNQGRCVCYSFSAALAGAMDYLRADQSPSDMVPSAREVHCQSNGSALCRFEVTATPR